MKKLAILLITALTICSCGDEVEFNTPAFQGNKNYNLWRADSFNATIDENGYLTLTGRNSTDEVQLTIPSVAVGTYTIGEIAGREAKVITADGTVYSTNNRPDESISVYPELGEVKIEEIGLNTFTGTFEFLAFDESGLNSIGYNEGLFYRVPLVAGTIPTDIITCEDTGAGVSATQLAYENSFASDLEYIDSDVYASACAAYTTALETQFLYCGDEDNAIRDIIESLNACEFPCEYALQNTTTAQIAYSQATIGNFMEACGTYQFYLEEQLEICGDDDEGTIQLALDELNCMDSDADGIPDVYEDFDGDGILDNDDTDNDGLANYLDDDDDGDGVLTIFEATDEDGNPIDTDGDTDVDYLDNDDDGDGILTQDEGADPNMDGDPSDAVDTDDNGIPDYLDPM